GARGIARIQRLFTARRKKNKLQLQGRGDHRACGGDRLRAEKRGETILNTTTAISGENGRRWRPAPAIHVSVFLHAAAAVWLAAHPEAWPWALGVLGVNHLALFCATFWPRGCLLGPNLVRLPASAAHRRENALTFDDGPDPEVTPRVLEVLDRYHAKASFFC